MKLGLETIARFMEQFDYKSTSSLLKPYFGIYDYSKKFENRFLLYYGTYIHDLRFNMIMSIDSESYCDELKRLKLIWFAYWYMLDGAVFRGHINMQGEYNINIRIQGNVITRKARDLLHRLAHRNTGYYIRQFVFPSIFKYGNYYGIERFNSNTILMTMNTNIFMKDEIIKEDSSKITKRIILPIQIYLVLLAS